MRELEDNNWFPEILRRHQMDFLSMLARQFNLYKPVKKHINALLANELSNDWTDVCSGSGGPVLSLAGQNKVLLTDLYPPKKAFHLPVNIQYHPNPIDVNLGLPPGEGLITMFNSLHHFEEQAQINLLKNCQSANRAIIAVEILQPDLITFLWVLFSTTIGHWLLVPFMKPFSLKRLFFTYLCPIHTLTVFIDGIISVFKSKKGIYYETLAESLSTPKYCFDYIEIQGFYGQLTIIKGYPLHY